MTYATLAGPVAGKLQAALYHARRQRIGRIPLPAVPEAQVWAADGLGGTVSNLGGGTYEIDTAAAFQGAVCGPLAGDFTCTVTTAFGATYEAELGAAVGVITDPANDVYDGREAEGLYWRHSPAEFKVFNDKTGAQDYSAAEASPGSQTYTIARTGSTLTFSRNGVSVFSRTMAGTLYLYSQINSGSGRVSKLHASTTT